MIWLNIKVYFRVLSMDTTIQYQVKQELCDLLVTKTMELLTCIERKETSNERFQKLKKEVQGLQLAINNINVKVTYTLI